MELWIRSQDKENLIKANFISVRHIYHQEEITDNFGRIKEFKKGDYKGSVINVDNVNLGTYKTKERALEVLDEIQCHLVNINDSRDSYFYVYEMPKE